MIDVAPTSAGLVKVSSSGFASIEQAFAKAQALAQSPRPLFQIAGETYQGKVVKRAFRDGGYGSMGGTKWGRVLRDGASARPLRDTGNLERSVMFVATDAELVLGAPSAIRYAVTHQFGGTLRPKGKWLVIPQAPPLTPAQRRAVGAKGGFKMVFPEAFVLMHGPAGPGIYRKSRVQQASVIAMKRGKDGVYRRTAGRARYRSGSKGIELIGRFVKSVYDPPRPLFQWTAPGLQLVVREWEKAFGKALGSPSGGAS